MSVAALYFAYSIPIGARVLGRLGWKKEESMRRRGGKVDVGSEDGSEADDGVNARVWGLGPFHLGVFVSLAISSAC
jgi:hypothetical protein